MLGRDMVEYMANINNQVVKQILEVTQPGVGHDAQKIVDDAPTLATTSTQSKKALLSNPSTLTNSSTVDS